MTGWRIGYGVMPKDLAAHVTRLMTNSNSCTASFTQQAAIAALTGPQDEVFKMVEAFRRRRDMFVAGLNAIPGISCKVPKGAFYLFPNVKDLGKPSKEIADVLLNEGGVAALSGTDFGEYGEGYLRFSYANSRRNIAKALEQIEACTARLR
jgi:aspartate/methionine/tyrosine aminotransferase